MRAALIACAVAGVTLAACEPGGAADEAEAPAAEAEQIAWVADDPAACGLVRQDRMEWGLGLNESGFEMQEAVGDGVVKLRVWSAADADLAAENGVLTGTVHGPAWIAADVAPATGLIAYLDQGAAHLRVENEQFFCASDARDQM